MEISIENLNMKIKKNNLEELSNLILSTDPQENQKAINMICDLIFKNHYFAKSKIEACQHYGKTVYSIIKESLKQNKRTKSLFNMSHNVEHELRKQIIDKQLEIDPEQYKKVLLINPEMIHQVINNRIKMIKSISQTKNMINKKTHIEMILNTKLC